MSRSLKEILPNFLYLWLHCCSGYASDCPSENWRVDGLSPAVCVHYVVSKDKKLYSTFSFSTRVYKGELLGNT